jgi:hypothetical protein
MPEFPFVNQGFAAEIGVSIQKLAKLVGSIED